MEFCMPNKNEYTFVTEKKMASGMTTRITFQGVHWDNQRTAEFSVWLTVFRKRKQISNIVLHETGKDGLKTLLFAKAAILDFEKFIVEKYADCHKKIFINISWDDSRRRNVYYRGLKKEGYAFNKFNRKKVLSKKIYDSYMECS